MINESFYAYDLNIMEYSMGAIDQTDLEFMNVPQQMRRNFLGPC